MASSFHADAPSSGSLAGWSAFYEFRVCSKVRRLAKKETAVKRGPRFRAGADGLMRCGVGNGFRVLAFSTNPEHVAMSRQYEALRGHLSRRRESILAHGLIAADERQFRAFWETLLPFLGVQEAEVPRWPDLEF